jgi:exodeoxyribonuclease VII small subunit
MYMTSGLARAVLVQHADESHANPPHHFLTSPPPPVNAWCVDEEKTDLAAMSFEDALRALEQVVRRLESGEVPLDESISLYERGEQLRAHCQRRLDAAQARIEAIVQGADGKPTGTVPFDAA